MKIKRISSLVLAFVILFSAQMAVPMQASAAGAKISCSAIVKRGKTNYIKVNGKKNTKYYIRVKCPKGSWSSSQTVNGTNKSKKTNKNGVATWSFKIGSGSTSKGTYKICIYSDKACKKLATSKNFRVQ